MSNPMTKSKHKFKIKTLKNSVIERILKQMNANSDPEMISENISIVAMPTIGKYLVKLMNESFEKGKFPETWKSSVK